ncbi:MAG: glycosyltransferase, partial [Dehalococcoidia bacterium]
MNAPQPNWYFTGFEHRRPPQPSTHVIWRETLWQVLATIAVVIGIWYLHWRWTASLNFDALWFAIPLVIAETLSFFGLVLVVFNLWQITDTPRQKPPRTIGECEGTEESRPLRVDIYVATYSEDPELVRMSLAAARRLRYPHPIELKVHCLDDGRRPAMAEVAAQEGVNYITRQNNIGYKAGNLRNALEVTDGDFLVICDADTRMFPDFLEATLGYFRDPDVAWVQTPQWFFDLPEGDTLDQVWGRRLGGVGRLAGKAVQRVIGEVRRGDDPFDNNPFYFFDVIQRRRNGANASFCCGAGSVHRREAVWQSALRAYANQIDAMTKDIVGDVKDPESREALEGELRRQFAIDQEVTPYKFHVSEDIYTSLILHGDRVRPWRSVYHPGIHSKMLSPQDMASWTVQRFKYAAGTIDIAVHDNPIIKQKLSLSQRLMYGATMWSYLSSLWNWVFLLAPALYLFTGIPPVSAFSVDFFKHFLPFFLAYEVALIIGTWGVPNAKGRAFFMGFFPYGLRAIWTVLRGQPIKFPVTPKERQSGRFLRIVRWQIVVIVLNALGIAWATVAIFILDIRGDVTGFAANVLWAGYTILLRRGFV